MGDQRPDEPPSERRDDQPDPEERRLPGDDENKQRAGDTMGTRDEAGPGDESASDPFSG